MRDTDLVQLAERFQSEDRCRRYLAALRWPNGVRWLKCGGERVYLVTTRARYECAETSCRHQFSVTVGTIFHDSHLPLWKWMLAAYLMCESKKGMSANQIKRTLKVSYKTAWYLCHRIRAAMKDASAGLLSGTVEADETYVGGEVEKHADRSTLRGFIRRHTAPDTGRIMTDEYAAYEGIGDHDTTHETVNHSADEWVRGDVHTDTVEGVFSLFKRAIIGAYHRLSAKHLPAYLDEVGFNHNNRHNPYLFRDTVLRLLSAESLPFRRLVEHL